MRRIVKWPLIVVAVAVAIGLVFDSNWLKGPVERMVTAKTGREFVILGALDIVPRWHPRVRMEGVRLANPPWALEPETLRIEAAEVSIALGPLLAGRIVLPQVTLTKPVIDLEKDREGGNNWTFGRGDAKDPEKRGEPPVIGRLTVDQGLLLFHDPAQETALSLEVETAAAASGEPAVRFHAFGRYQGQRVEAEGTGGSMLRLADTEAPYPLDGRFQVGATKGTVAGTITGLAMMAAVDLKLDFGGETLSELFPLLHVALPPTPPYRIAGRLIRENAWWRFHDFDGRVGDSDLSGDVDVTYGNGRSRIEATLASQVLDLDDLGGFIGATPSTGPGETASKKQQQQAAAKDASGKLLPDVPIKLDRLRTMDADVRFAGKSIRGKTALEDIETHLVLQDGLLTLKPLNFGVADGNVVSTLILDGRNELAGVDGDFEFRRIDLRKVFPGNQTVAKSTGLVGGRAVLKGRGNTLADVLAGADGTLGLAMSGGQVSNLVLELAGLDIAEALRLLFGGDKPVKMRCAVADVSVKQGLIQARHVLLDTTDTNISVDGTMNLANEELDVTLHPLPKDYSPLTLRSPIHIRGTFKNPAIRPDKQLAIRGGIAAILGAIAAPAVALVGLVESGPGDNADCEHLIAAMERHAGQDVPEAGSP
jgi:AsmA family protein